MSFTRLIFYSAVLSGWAAFLGWLIAEAIVLRGAVSESGIADLALVGSLIGAAIGAGLNVAAGLSNANWKLLLKRVVPGLLGGAFGGGLGILIGNGLYAAAGLPRTLGFMVLGLGVGIVDGVYERSISKTRNGVIGGLLGGLAGGVLFDPLASAISSESGMSSRATAFVILGLCVGALVGFAQVVLKDAWLTVMDGYGTGRQIILSRPVTTLGRGEHLPLAFLGPSNAELALEHLRIARQNNGDFAVEDTGSRLGTSVRRGTASYERINSPFVLADGDVIKLGTNLVRFNERRRRSSSETIAIGSSHPIPITVRPPPPPIVHAAKPLAASSSAAPTARSPSQTPAASTPGQAHSTLSSPPKPRTPPPPPPPPPPTPPPPTPKGPADRPR